MKIKKNFVLLLSAFLIFVMAFAAPVWAQDSLDSDENKTGSEGIVLISEGDPISPPDETMIESSTVGAYLSAVNTGSVALIAESIYGTEAGVYIDVDSSGSVTLNSQSIQSEASALEIIAGSGTVNVENEGFIDGYTAVSMVNEDAKLDVIAGQIDSIVGISIQALGGATKAESEDIYADGYGVIVDASAKSSAPVVTVNVNGGIWDQVAAGSWEEEEPIELDMDAKAAEDESSDEIDPYDDEWWEQDLDGTWTGDEDDNEWNDVDWGDDWDDDEEEPIDVDGFLGSTTGVLINAEGKGTSVTVNVTDDISMGYGNEVQVYSEAAVDVFVGGDVVTDYGNRISAVDSGKAEFTFGGDIDAGGKALDTYSDSGTLTVQVAGDILAQDTDDGDFETAGIYSNSEGTGETTINVEKGINVSSAEADYVAYGIDTANIGGTITISVEENVTVTGNQAVGISVVNDPEAYDFGEDEEDAAENEGAEPDSVAHAAELSNPATKVTVNGNVSADGSEESTGMEIWNDNGKTNITIDGDLTGSTYGLDVEAYGTDRNASFTDILVTGTISGKSAGVLVNEEADNDGTDDDNLNLTVWKVDLTGSSNAAQNEDGSKNVTVEDNINYIIKIAPDSQDKIEVVKEDGITAPDQSHDFPVAKKDEKIYVLSADGSELEGVTNGNTKKTALKKDGTGYYLEVPNGGGVWLAVGTPEPEPVTPPHRYDIYRLCDRELPATGFSASHMTALPARPQGLAYASTGLTLQIPGLDIAEEILTVPETDSSYPVEWLGSSIGLLEGSSLPGRGITVLTGHNHLNTMEAGPFLFLSKLEDGDLLMVNDRFDRIQVFRVFGNYKIASDGFASIVPELKDNALVLITCEDESVDGGYLNRRVVLAKPL